MLTRALLATLIALLVIGLIVGGAIAMSMAVARSAPRSAASVQEVAPPAPSAEMASVEMVPGPQYKMIEVPSEDLTDGTVINDPAVVLNLQDGSVPYPEVTNTDNMFQETVTTIPVLQVTDGSGNPEFGNVRCGDSTYEMVPLADSEQNVMVQNPSDVSGGDQVTYSEYTIASVDSFTNRDFWGPNYVPSYRDQFDARPTTEAGKVTSMQKSEMDGIVSEQQYTRTPEYISSSEEPSPTPLRLTPDARNFLMNR